MLLLKINLKRTENLTSEDRLFLQENGELPQDKEKLRDTRIKKFEDRGSFFNFERNIVTTNYYATLRVICKQIAISMRKSFSEG